MSPTNAATHAEAMRLLETAIRGIVILQDDLRIFKEKSGTRLDWILQPHARDFGAIIGARGSHLGALRLIAQKLGEEVSEHWRIESPDDGGRGPQFFKRVPVPEPDSHDSRPDERFLLELLEGMKIPALVQSGAATPSGFLFKIKPNTREAQAALLDPDPEDRSDNLLAALGTIFRAMGRRQGVRYEVALL